MYDSGVFSGLPILSNPWADSAKEISEEYFLDHSTLAIHTAALKKSPIGEKLSNLAKERNVTIELDKFIPDIAQYVHTPGSKVGGTVKYTLAASAHHFGHELRHAWQHLGGACEVIPYSPEERIVYSRFMEADARAVEFIMALQCIGPKEIRGTYQRFLLASLEPHQKDYCQRSEVILETLLSDPVAMRQAARRVFDDWISMSPNQPSYEERLAQQISLGQEISLKNQFSDALSFFPPYTHRGVSPEFMSELTKKLGDVLAEDGKNYLLDTKGPRFNSDFYTRVCNHRLERLADRYAPKHR